MIKNDSMDAVSELDAVVEGAAEQAAPAQAAEDAPAATEDDIEGEDDEELDSEDSLTYANGVIEKIVAMATREVPHVLGMKGNLVHFFQEQLGAENLTKGVTIEVTDDNRVIINISVIIEYGCYAPDIFDDVKERVVERLDAMTGLEVAGINLRIEDVLTREEYEASRKKLIDNLKPEDKGDEEAEE
ncbi:Asp23/Gls24 family envelope stress response protein [Enorma burkinafasonensis]|uniref:Asp23/Gls24 family envelope stress response protein n=1 Tax=Enorma burkinafasonensis TaxID=2590867 RepID=UPI0011A342F8|nr:Asp23/Gls24 family envelope stress response protein [Enorma burkinafasonensis]